MPHICNSLTDAIVLSIGRPVTQVPHPLSLIRFVLHFLLYSHQNLVPHLGTFLFCYNDNMKSFAATLALILIVANHQVAGFGGSFAGSKLSTSVVNSGSISMEYIPK